MANLARAFHELEVYQVAFEFQQSIFTASKAWPNEERYALTDQIRRSSRSIGANIAESWAKRRYPAHFISKLSDSDGELQETLHWLATAAACGYIAHSDDEKLRETARLIGRSLGRMMSRHDSFGT